MTGSRRRWAIVAAVLLLSARTACAFDESVHYTVIYAVAVVAGYTPDDAQIIARASQSLDDNSSTTAYDSKNNDRLIRELKEVFTPTLGPGGITNISARRRPEDITHMAPGQVFHSLASDENRAVVSLAHVERLKRFRAEPGSLSVERRQTELIYLGQYLHFVADMFVHPPDPLVGHFLKGHAEDRANRTTEQLVRAIGSIKTALDQYGGAHGQPGDPSRMRTVSPTAISHDPVPIGDDERFRRVAQVVADSWNRSYPDVIKQLTDTYGESTERERAAMAAADVARELRKYDLPYRNYRPDRDAFRYDGEGNAIGIDRGVAGPPPPFVTATASNPSLVRERRWAVAKAIGLIGRRTANLLEGPIPQALRLFASLPSTPGGIALDPNLQIRGLSGTPRAITIDNENLVLETTAARYLIGRVHPRTFATVLRALAVGQAPFLSIGSEPSDRPGYARVTYAPAFRGTREGRVMYEADVRFKAFMTDIPLTRREGSRLSQILGPNQFPIGGGEFARLWITSRNFELAPDGTRLIVRSREMRIESERMLGGRVQPDAQLEAYGRHLSTQWDRLAELFWEFGAVEDIALATGLVYWARRNNVEIAPALALIAPKAELTPDYAPLLARWDGTVFVSGGVALTPEDKRVSSGRALLSYVAQTIGAGGWNSESSAQALVALALAIGAVSLLVPPAVLWLLFRIWDRPTGRRRLWRILVSRWAMAVGAVLVLAAITHFVVIRDLFGPFDRDFLAFGVGVVAFPVILLALLRPLIRSDAAAPLRVGAIVVAVLGSPVAGQVGVATALLTVSATGLAPTPTLNIVLSLQLAAADRFSEGLCTVIKSETGGEVILLPRSALEAAQRAYQSNPRSVKAAPEELWRIGTADPKYPFDRLQRIRVERTPAGIGYYSIDGKLPF